MAPKILIVGITESGQMVAVATSTEPDGNDVYEYDMLIRDGTYAALTVVPIGIWVDGAELPAID